MNRLALCIERAARRRGRSLRSHPGRLRPRRKQHHMLAVEERKREQTRRHMRKN